LHNEELEGGAKQKELEFLVVGVVGLNTKQDGYPSHDPYNRRSVKIATKNSW